MLSVVVHIGVLIHLAPRHRFGRRARGQRAVSYRRRYDLHVEVVAAHVRDAEHLTKRGFRLEVVVLRNAAAENEGRKRMDGLSNRPQRW